MIITFGAVIGGIATLIKAITLIALALKGVIRASSDDIILYKLFGIYVENNKPYLGQMDIFMSLFFDLSEILICIILSLLYQHEEKQIKLSKQDAFIEIMLLNPIFPKYIGFYSVVTLVTILINSIFIQTFF